MKPSQILLVFVGVFVFLTVGLLAITHSPDQLLAQSAPVPTIGKAPTTGTMPPTSPTQNESASALPWEIDALYQTYLPAIMTPACQLNGNEAALASLITSNSDQGRPSMNCNPTLAQVARQRALDMGYRNYCNHVNPDGMGPNILVSNAGYRLPAGWTSPPTLNYIESIACGFPTAQDAFNAWMASSGHRTHVLGRDSFWAAQTNYGVGYAEIASGDYRFYWVFISAPPE